MAKNNKEKKITAVILAILVVTAVFLVLYYIFGMEPKGNEIRKAVLVPKNIDESNGFWTTLITGANLGAEEFNIRLQVLGGSSETDIDQQIRCIRSGMETKPDVMLVAPGSYTRVSDVLQEVTDSGIKLVLIDSLIDRDIAKSVVATDNYLAGNQLGEFAKTLAGAESKIAIVAHVKGASTAMEREKGIRDGLGEYEKNIVETVYCNSSYDKAYELTEELLAKYPDIELIIGTNEYSSVGAARAVKALGVSGKVKMAGFDNSIEEIQLLEEGVFSGLVIQKPFNMGYLGMEQAEKLIRGERTEKNIDSGCRLVTRQNMYEEENQRLLYPFIGQK